MVCVHSNYLPDQLRVCRIYIVGKRVNDSRGISDQKTMVGKRGLEPLRLAARASKTRMAAITSLAHISNNDTNRSTINRHCQINLSHFLFPKSGFADGNLDKEFEDFPFYNLSDFH